MTDNVVFVDIETTGLNPWVHEPWEIALIVDDIEHVWQVPVNLGKADPQALRVSRFYERRLSILERPEIVAWDVARLTAERHLVGVNPAFDAAFLGRFLHANGCSEAWHYHLVDVLPFAAGWLYGYREGSADAKGKDGIVDEAAELPWSSTELSLAIGVDPDNFGRHTALGDARWAQAMYKAATS